MTTHQKYISDLKSAWRNPEALDDNILQDGQILRVRMMMMDGEPAPLRSPVLDHDANRPMLDSAQEKADRVQAYADHFTAQRATSEAAARAQSPAYHDYLDRLKSGTT